MSSTMCNMISPALLELLETPPIDFPTLDEFYAHIQVCPACTARFPERVVEAQTNPDQGLSG